MTGRHCIIVFLFLSISAHAQLVGKVISIADGDTFTMLTTNNKQLKIRLHGIDCPEQAQAYGQVAKKFLSDLIYSKTVNVRETDIDRYGRTVGIVMIDTLNVNESLLKAGLAWHYKRYDQNSKWSAIELKARNESIGLWTISNPTPPWEWRRNK